MTKVQLLWILVNLIGKDRLDTKIVKMNSARILTSISGRYLKYIFSLIVLSGCITILPIFSLASELHPSKSAADLEACYFTPVAVDDVFQMVEGTILASDVSMNDSDPNNLPLSYSIVGFPTNGTLSLNNIGTFTYEPMPGFIGVDVFSYEVSNTNNETSQANVTININPCLLNVSIDSLNTACTDEVVSLSSQTNDVGILYKWEFGLDASPNTSTQDNPTVSWSVPGPKMIILTINNTICAYSDTMMVTILDGGFSDAGITQTICSGDSVQIGGNPSGPANVAFQWTPTAGLDDPTAANPIASPSATTVYTLEVSVNGCAPKASSVEVIVKPLPYGDAGPDYAVCSEQTVTLGGMPTGPPDANYSWSPVTGLDDPFSQNPTLTTTTTTTYTLTVEFEGCTGTDEVIVGVLPKPIIHPINDEYLCLGDTNGVLIGTPNFPNLTYHWSPTTGLADPTSSTTVANPSQTTIYELCVTNQVGCTNCEQLTVVINNCNDKPLALNDDNLTILNTPVIGNLLTNDRDLDMDVLEYKQLIVPPTNGTIVINTDGSYTYTPNTGFLGTEYLEYEVCDLGTGIAGCDTANLKIEVRVNDVNNNKPIAVDDTYILAEGVTSFNGRLSENDSDPDDDKVNITIVPISTPKGTLSMLSNGEFTYNPVVGFLGVDTFIYELCDISPNILCDSGVVTFIIQEDLTQDRAPIAQDDLLGIEMNGTLNGNLLENDSDPEGTPLTLNLVTISGPSNGIINLQVNGLFEYTPNAGFVGQDIFVYEVTDAAGKSSAAQVEVNVYSFNNNIPEAYPDYTTTLSGNLIDINVIENDKDIDRDALSLTVTPIIPPTNGTVIMLSNGVVRYKPTSGFTGTDSFTYEICDNISGCSNATVQIKVVADTPLINEAPIGTQDNFTTFTNTTLTGNVLDNDLDLEGDQLSLSTTLIDTPDFGQVVPTINGMFSYTPTTSFTGIDQFIYEVCDLGGLCDTITANINIINPNNNNSSPSALNNFYSTAESTPLNENILSNDFDPDADVLILNVTPTVPPLFGTVQLGSDGAFTYIPNIGFKGTDRFDYEICDANNNCTIGKVYIEVSRGNFGLQPNNLAPHADDDAIVTYIDRPVVGRMDYNDYDPEFSFVIYATAAKVAPANGSVTIDSTGGFVYTPNTGYSGPDQFVYTVCDAVQTCVNATVYVIVFPFNNAPIAINDDNATLVNIPFTGKVLANDFDIENNNLIPKPDLITNPSFGTVIFNTDGTYDYTPALDYIGNDFFEYEVCDDGEPGPICSVAKVNINVFPEGQTAINTAPITNDDDLVTYVNIPIGSVVLSNDHDIENDSLWTVVLQQPDNGFVIMTPDGAYNYLPNNDFEGDDSFVYRVCDDGSPMECNTGTVFIKVLPPVRGGITSYKPFAADDFAACIEDSIVLGNVILNDLDIDGDPLTATVISPPTNGTFTLKPNGNFDYIPNPGYAGPDQSTYEVCDGTTDCSEATIYFLTQRNRCVNISLRVFMEGPYNVVGDTMNTFLGLKQGSSLHRGLLPGQTPLNIGLGVQPTPSGQPYYKSPWFYPGTEGAGWTNTNYNEFQDTEGNSVVDWVIVSFRTSTTNTILQMAGLLMDDGEVVFLDPCNFTLEPDAQYYVVVEHRNHMGIMTPNPVVVLDRTLTYDFTTQDSYTGVNGFGCKQLEPGVWGMYASDGDQSDLVSYDINGSDKILWTNDNGFFDKYIPGDYNMNGDVNGADRILWEENNGVTSRVPK